MTRGRTGRRRTSPTLSCYIERLARQLCREWDNLWDSRGGSMVNRAPREFSREYSMYSLGRRLKVPQGIL